VLLAVSDRLSFPIPMKLPLFALFGWWSCASLLAASAPTAVPRSTSGPQKSGDFVFSLLPKAFQREPALEMTVNTEFTDFGRLLRAATPEQPVYYESVAAGFKPLGAPMGGEHPPAAATLERAMKKSPGGQWLSPG